jgi:rod shape-determining protein MreD
VLRGVLLVAASLAAILIQVTMLNRLALPGGAAPDLVLIMVVAVALTGGPMEGMLAGFCTGLALDVAPPASHLVGQYALVFCLAGYAAGRLSGGLDHANWLPAGAVALCAAGGEALYAATGMLFGDPGVTWAAVRHVLPVSVGYDLLLCPFVLFAVVAARAWSTPGWAGSGFDTPRSVLAGLGPLVPAGAGRAVRDSGTGRSPRLRAGTARPGDGWIGGAGQRAGRTAPQVLAPRPLHLRLRGGQPGSARATTASKTLPARPLHLRFSPGRRKPGSTARGAKGAKARPVHLRLGAGRRRDGAVGGSVLSGRAPGSKAPRGRVPRGSALRGSGSGGALGRGGASLRGSLWPGSGRGAQPRFRRRPARSAASAGISRRGGVRGGGLLRRSRGRARFGRRSTVWRIGSRRTGGLS